MSNRDDPVFVLAPGMWQNSDGPAEWWAVATDNMGIVAYFYYESDAKLFAQLLRWAEGN